MEIWTRNIGLIRGGGGDFFKSVYLLLPHFLSQVLLSGLIREKPVTVSNVLIKSSASASLSRHSGHNTRCEEDDFIVAAIDLGGAAAAAAAVVVVASVASGFEAGHGFEAAAKKEQEHECTDPA